MNGKKSHNFRVFTNYLAFLLLIAIAILLIVERFVPLETGFSAILGEIAKYLAIFLVSIASLWYVASKRSIVVKIIWLIAVTSIVVLMFV